MLCSFSPRVKHRSNPGGSGGGHQWDCEAFPQAREGGERRQSRRASTCNFYYSSQMKKGGFLLWWSPSPSTGTAWFYLLGDVWKDISPVLTFISFFDIISDHNLQRCLFVFLSSVKQSTDTYKYYLLKQVVLWLLETAIEDLKDFIT